MKPIFPSKLVTRAQKVAECAHAEGDASHHWYCLGETKVPDGGGWTRVIDWGRESGS